MGPGRGDRTREPTCNAGKLFTSEPSQIETSSRYDPSRYLYGVLRNHIVERCSEMT